MARQMNLGDWFVARVDKIDKGVEKLAEDVAEEGQRLVREAIETRGTGRSWSRVYTKNGISRDASKPGRVWTGLMRDSVEQDVTAARGGVIASFGWLRRYEDYFGDQEGGFRHSSGIDVPGMFAMEDAKDHMFNYVKSRVREVVRGV